MNWVGSSLFKERFHQGRAFHSKSFSENSWGNFWMMMRLFSIFTWMRDVPLKEYTAPLFLTIPPLFIDFISSVRVLHHSHVLYRNAASALHRRVQCRLSLFITGIILWDGSTKRTFIITSWKTRKKTKHKVNYSRNIDNELWILQISLCFSFFRYIINEISQ